MLTVGVLLSLNFEVSISDGGCYSWSFWVNYLSHEFYFAYLLLWVVLGMEQVSLDLGGEIGGKPISFWRQATLIDHEPSLWTLGSFYISSSSWCWKLKSADILLFPFLLIDRWGWLLILCISRWSLLHWEGPSHSVEGFSSSKGCMTITGHDEDGSHL